MNVLFLTNIPAPYMVDFFNEFGKLCNLTVIFERSSSTERDKSWGRYSFVSFNGIILKGAHIGVDGAFNISILSYLLKDVYDFTIIANPTTPTGILAILFLKLLKREYIIESEGGFAKNGKGFKEIFKKFIFSNAHAYFSTTKIGDEYFLAYGARKSNIYKYPFSSIYKKEIKDFQKLSSSRLSARHKLGVKYKNVILSVGSIIPRKGHDITLRAFHMMNDDDTGLYIVGGQMIPELAKLIDDLKIRNVHFVEFVNKEEVSIYYEMADVFVLATRYDTWGLVINEAMAYGLPVITTDMCVAGSELVVNDKNGFIVSSEDCETLSSRMKILIKDESLRDSFARETLLKIQNYTIDEMASEHHKLLVSISSAEVSL